MIKIGVQISSVRKYLTTERDVLESFSKVSKLGYKEIQIQWISPEVSSEFIHDALKETQLNCIGTQDYYDEVIPKLDEIIRMNDQWGGKYICVSRIPDRFRSSEGCVFLASELNRISEQVEDAGKTLVFHPIHSDYMNYNGQTLLDILIKNTTTKMQVELDVYHVKKAGYDPVDWINKLDGRMDLIHFKDMAITQEGKEILTPVGQGILDWDNIFNTCIKTGVKYCFAEQETWQKDPFECLGESYNFITNKIFNAEYTAYGEEC